MQQMPARVDGDCTPPARDFLFALGSGVLTASMICAACHHDNHIAAAVCFNCGKALWMVTRGSIVGGRYEVLSVLGQGGMGMVYKAQDRTLDEPVALKVLRPEVAPTLDLGMRFHSEIKLARRVRHRNVCAIHEYGEDGPLRYIAMEFVEGANLRELVRKQGPLPPEDACDVALQVLDGLGAVHDLGIIHRDLKAANIMRDTQGVIRLMDFGLATVRRIDDSPATMTINLAGTPEYMSPEQVRGERGDFQSDIYALGIILFEILTGEVPFSGDSFLAIMQKQLNELPPLEGARAEQLPAQLVPVLRKTLAKDPRDRYATARGMATALRLVRGTIAPPAVVDLPPLREDWLDLVERNDDESQADRAEVLRALVQTLATGDVPERCVAALTLGRMGPRAKDTVPALIDALNDPHPHVAEAAASALRRIAGTPSAAAESSAPTPGPAESPAVIDLMDMLRHEDASLRRIAVVALGEARSVGRDAIPELVEGLEDRDEAVRREAARALGKIGATAAVPSLVVALSNAPDDLVRVSAAEALGQIGARATVAIPGLIAALKHADDGVCDAAAGALVMIGLPAAPALIEAVTDFDRRLRLRAAAVLTEIVAPSAALQSVSPSLLSPV
jgi:HEAT repeat protein/predicted Ser/Thr protein kinase